MTEKCDVYSFGVLVLELFMGCHPGDFLFSLLSSTKNNDVCLQDVLDSRLIVPNAETDREIYYILSVAARCLEPIPSSRQTARRVRDELSVIKVCEDHIDYMHTGLSIPSKQCL